MIHELKIKPTLKSFTDSSKTKKNRKKVLSKIYIISCSVKFKFLDNVNKYNMVKKFLLQIFKTIFFQFSYFMVTYWYYM